MFKTFQTEMGIKIKALVCLVLNKQQLNVQHRVQSKAKQGLQTSIDLYKDQNSGAMQKPSPKNDAALQNFKLDYRRA